MPTAHHTHTLEHTLEHTRMAGTLCAEPRLSIVEGLRLLWEGSAFRTDQCTRCTAGPYVPFIRARSWLERGPCSWRGRRGSGRGWHTLRVPSKLSPEGKHLISSRYLSGGGSSRYLSGGERALGGAPHQVWCGGGGCRCEQSSVYSPKATVYADPGCLVQQPETRQWPLLGPM